MFPKSKLALGFLGSLLVFSAMTFAAEAPRTPPQSPRGIRRETRPLQSPGARADTPKHVEDEILVRFKNGTPLPGKTSAHAVVSTATVKTFNIVNNLELVKLGRQIYRGGIMAGQAAAGCLCKRSR